MNLPRWVPLVLLAGCTAGADGVRRDPDSLYKRAILRFETDGGAAEIEGLLDEAIKLRPDFADALVARAALRHATGRSLEAVDDYSRAIQAVPTHAVARCSRGILLMGQGKTAEAENDFTAWIQAAPDTPDAYLMRSYLYRRMGRFTDAIQDQSEARARGPARWEAYYNAAHTAAKRKSWADAEFNYELAVLLAPGLVEAFIGLSHVHAAQGRLAEAVEDLTRVLKLHPTDGSIWYSRAELHRGLGDFKTALADYDLGLQYSAVAILHIGRGRALEALGRHAAADAAYSRAIELEPLNRDAFVARGFLRRMIAQPKEAETDFKMALGLRATADVGREMARIYVEKESWDEAVKYYELALKVCPEGLLKAEIERELSETRRKIR